jgi:glycine/serine hydroxymethyltransferase
MKEPEMVRIAELINTVLSAPEDANLATRVRDDVKDLTARFPLYPVSFNGKGAE